MEKKFNPEILKAIRKKYKYTQETFGKFIGTSKSNYGRKEKGEVVLTVEEFLTIFDKVKKDHPEVDVKPESLDLFLVKEPTTCPDQHKCQKVKEKFPWCYDMLEFCFKRLGYTDKELTERIIDDLRGKIKDFEIEERLGEKLEIPEKKAKSGK